MPAAKKKSGLYANIHAKQERIAHGSGETMRKPGSAGAPTQQAFEQAQKTEKKPAAKKVAAKKASARKKPPARKQAAGKSAATTAAKKATAGKSAGKKAAKKSRR